LLFGFLVGGVRPAEAAELLEFKLLRRSSLVFSSGIITLLALSTCKSDDISHYKAPSIANSRYNRQFIQRLR
jgi:hypothetical protein